MNTHGPFGSNNFGNNGNNYPATGRTNLSQSFNRDVEMQIAGGGDIGGGLARLAPPGTPQQYNTGVEANVGHSAELESHRPSHWRWIEFSPP